MYKTTKKLYMIRYRNQINNVQIYVINNIGTNKMIKLINVLKKTHVKMLLLIIIN